MRGAVRIALLSMGLSGLVAQLLLLRELLIIFSGNEFSIGIILANWLILEAFGCLFLSNRAETAKNRVEFFVLLTILFILSLLSGVYLTRILKNILGASIGENLSFLTMLYSSFLILLPTSVTHGTLFPLGCKIYAEHSSPDATAIGRVYVYETIGTILGGIIWTYLLIPYLHAFHILFVLAILNLLVCLSLLTWSPHSRKLLTIIVSGLLFLSGYLLATRKADKIHRLSVKAQWRNLNVVHYQNSLYGNVCVVESESQYLFFTDGIAYLIVPVPDIWFIEGFVNIPLLSHPDPGRVLIISNGTGGVINEVLKHPYVKFIEYVELDPLLLELMKRFSTPLTERELKDERVKVRYTDGRLFLRTTPNRYDVILVGLHDPADLQVNRFFTLEFFSLAKTKLAENGILVIGLPGLLTYPNQELKNLNACIYNTLKQVFSAIRVFPGDGVNLFLASETRDIFKLTKDELILRLEKRGVRASVPVARHIEKKLHPGWQDWFLSSIKGGSKKLNLDFKPLGVFYSISYWNTIFAPYLRIFFRWLDKLSLWPCLFLFATFVAIALSLHRRIRVISNLGIPFCIATTGFAGMIFDLTLIFAFQSIYGYIFGWIGLLVTSFMTGAATGAIAMIKTMKRIRVPLRVFVKIEVMIVLFSLALPILLFLLSRGLSGSDGVLKASFLLISLISGTLIGFQFPLANQIYLKSKTGISRTGGVLYSSDLLGGWLGGIIGGAVLLPVLGLLGTGVVIVLLKLSGLILLVLGQRSPEGSLIEQDSAYPFSRIIRPLIRSLTGQ